MIFGEPDTIFRAVDLIFVPILIPLPPLPVVVFPPVAVMVGEPPETVKAVKTV
jgi:hypothetical protein